MLFTFDLQILTLQKSNLWLAVQYVLLNTMLFMSSAVNSALRHRSKILNAVCKSVRSYPEHLVEVVILLSSGVQQEGLQEQPGVGSQPQHLHTHTHTAQDVQ